MRVAHQDPRTSISRSVALERRIPLLGNHTVWSVNKERLATAAKHGTSQITYICSNCKAGHCCRNLHHVSWQAFLAELFLKQRRLNEGPSVCRRRQDLFVIPNSSCRSEHHTWKLLQEDNFLRLKSCPGMCSFHDTWNRTQPRQFRDSISWSPMDWWIFIVVPDSCEQMDIKTVSSICSELWACQRERSYFEGKAINSTSPKHHMSCYIETRSCGHWDLSL